MFLYFLLASNELDPIPDFRTPERKVRPLQPPNNSLIHPARLIWCRGAGFFYIQTEFSGGEAKAITVGISKIIITKYIFDGK